MKQLFPTSLQFNITMSALKGESVVLTSSFPATDSDLFQKLPLCLDREAIHEAGAARERRVSRDPAAISLKEVARAP